MELQDPIAIYTATTNLEAHLIARHLNTYRVAAVAVENESLVGKYSLGTIAESQRPQIRVDRINASKALKLIEAFNDPSLGLHLEPYPEPSESLYKLSVRVENYCHACGESVSPEATICPGCDRPLNSSDAEEPSSFSLLDTLQSLQKPLIVFALLTPLFLLILLGIVKGLFNRYP